MNHQCFLPSRLGLRTVNIKPKMKPAFVEEAPRAIAGIDASVPRRRHSNNLFLRAMHIE
jgi:hypothetical protein